MPVPLPVPVLTTLNFFSCGCWRRANGFFLLPSDAHAYIHTMPAKLSLPRSKEERLTASRDSLRQWYKAEMTPAKWRPSLVFVGIFKTGTHCGCVENQNTVLCFELTGISTNLSFYFCTSYILSIVSHLMRTCYLRGCGIAPTLSEEGAVHTAAMFLHGFNKQLSSFGLTTIIPRTTYGN